MVLLGGGTGPIRSDCVACTIAGPTLIDQLEASHLSWAAFLQGPPRPCSAVARAGRVATIVAGPRVRAGRDPTTYDHYALLRSIEAAYGLPFLGHAADPATATIPALAGPAPAAV